MDFLAGLGTLLGGIRQAGPLVLGGIAIGSGILLFGSTAFIDVLGLTEWRSANRSSVGVTFLASSSLLTAFAIAGLVTRLQSQAKRRRRRAGQRAQLGALTAAEKAYLAPFVLDGENTVSFPANDGVAGGLVAKGILYISSSIGTLHAFPHNMQPWARELLEANPDLLAGAGTIPRRSPWA